MAKFCKYCGSPLEEGQACTCAASQAAAQPAPAAEPAAAPVAAPAAAPSPLVADLKDILLGGLKEPRQTGAKLLASGSKLPIAGILAGIHAITLILLIWQCIGSLFGSIMDMIGGAAGSLVSAYLPDIEYPVFLFILGGIILAAVAIAVSGLLVFGFAKLNKKELSIVDALVLAAGDSLYPSILVLLTVILGFIGIVPQLLALLLLLVVSILNTVENGRIYSDLHVGTSLKSYLILAAGILVAVLLICFAAKLVFVDWCLLGVKINGISVSDGLEMAGDLGDLLGSLGDLLG